MEGLLLFFIVVFVVLPMIPYWVLYSKCGQPGWASIIPIYNIIVLLNIVNKPVWWLLLLCIPIVNVIVMIIILNRLAMSFGQGAGFTLGLLFLPVIFLLLLAFGNYKYTALPV